METRILVCSSRIESIDFVMSMRYNAHAAIAAASCSSY
jgi:hypothetical protein